jgi:hypothetical protein
MRIIAASIDLSKIDKKRIVDGKTGGKYYDFTVIVNDAPDQYGKDVSITAGQTKEERDSKIPKTFIGGGKTIFTKEPEGKNNANPPASSSSSSDDLPFMWLLIPFLFSLAVMA